MADVRENEYYSVLGNKSLSDISVIRINCKFNNCLVFNLLLLFFIVVGWPDSFSSCSFV